MENYKKQNVWLYPWPENLAMDIFIQPNKYCETDIPAENFIYGIKEMLTPKESQIVQLFYEEKEMAVNVGKIVGLTASRTQQIRLGAIRKLRHTWVNDMIQLGEKEYIKTKERKCRNAAQRAKIDGFLWSEEKLLEPVEKLGLTSSAITHLHREDIRTYGDLLAYYYDVLNGHIDAFASMPIINRRKSMYHIENIIFYAYSPRILTACHRTLGYIPSPREFAQMDNNEIGLLQGIGEKSLLEISQMIDFVTYSPD